MEKTFEKPTASEKLAKFFQVYKKLLITLVVIVAVVLLAYGIVSAVLSKNIAKDLEVIDSISYVTTKDSAQIDDAVLETKSAAALKELAPYIKKSGDVGVRANMLAAGITYTQKKYAESAEYWLSAAEKSKKSYTAPICYFNAASSYEEAEKLDEAVTYYQKAASFADFDQVNHAKFSLGRVLEAKGDVAGALTAYSDLFAASPSDSWGLLAKSRLIALENTGK